MTLPNLVGCGAGKSGTTSLYYYLAQHPQIFMAAAKEVHFFSRHYERGLAWYESHFPNDENVPVVGEFSTSYMLDPDVPERMAATIPNARLLFIFRDPIERAYSNYWFSVSIGTEERDRSFSEVIRADEGFEKYVAHGFYYEHLQRFLSYYDLNQIHFMITEALGEEPLKQMAPCYRFLGVDPSFEPDVAQNYNVTMTANGWLAPVYSSWMAIKTEVKPFVKRFPLGLRKMVAKVEKQVFGRSMSRERAPIPEEDVEYLRDIYRERNERLAEVVGLELSYWRS